MQMNPQEQEGKHGLYMRFSVSSGMKEFSAFVSLVPFVVKGFSAVPADPRRTA
jgi:hypothetical protein